MKQEIDKSKYIIGIDAYDKQETLEEVAKEFFRKFKHTHSPDNYYLALVEFTGWQQERSYSEEEVKQIIDATLIEYSDFVLADIPEWFDTVKNK